MATKAAKFKAWDPYTPPPIPAGSYDPALDAQLGQAQRGLGDSLQDIGTQASRATTDYGLSLDQINRTAGRNSSDLTQQRDDSLYSLGQQHDRGLADYGTQQTRGQQDYDRNTQMLAQSYQRLKGQQNQAANAAGVLTGGAVLQAAAKRQANQAQDQQGLDTSWTRAQQDNAQGVSRLNEDYTHGTSTVARDYATQSGRATEDADLQRGMLALQGAPPGFGSVLGGRTFQDLNTQATRAQRENQIYGLDVEGQKAYQASASGYVPPARGEAGGQPSNEFVAGDGTHYRVIVKNGRRYRIDSTGRIIGS